MIADIGGMMNVRGIRMAHAVGAAEARQHADDRAEGDPGDGDHEIVGLERDLKAEEEVLESHEG